MSLKLIYIVILVCFVFFKVPFVWLIPTRIVLKLKFVFLELKLNKQEPAYVAKTTKIIPVTSGDYPKIT